MQRIIEPVRPCDVETPNDLLTYYRGCVIGIPDSDGQTIPYSIQGVDDHNQVVVIPAVTGKGALQAIAFRDFRKSVTFAKPGLGMVNVGPTVVYTLTSAERRAEKGYRAEHVSIHGFNTWSLRHKQKEFAGLTGASSALLWSLFNKEYYGTLEARTLLNRGERVGCAISRHIALVLLEDCPNIVIAYKTSIAGHIGDRDVPMLSPEYVFAKKLFERTLGQEVIVR